MSEELDLFSDENERAARDLFGDEHPTLSSAVGYQKLASTALAWEALSYRDRMVYRRRALAARRR